MLIKLVLLVLALLIIMVLVLPITTVFRMQWDKEVRGVFLEVVPFVHFLKFEKSWFFGQLGQEGIAIKQETEGASGRQLKAGEERLSFREICRRFQELTWLRRWWNSPAARRSLHRIRFQKISWQTRVSTGDAAHTAILTGVIWAIKGMMLAWAASRFQVTNPQIEVWPDWGQASLQTRVDCIVRTRLAHIIAIGLVVACYYLRYQVLSR